MRLRDERGSFYILAVVICTVLSILSHILITNISAEYLKCKRMEDKLYAFNLAEAGIEKAIWNLKKGNKYTGESDTPLGKGKFSVNLEEKGSMIYITSTGYIQKTKAKEKVKVIIDKEDLGLELWEQK
ncbi:MAG: hypothetical protein ABH870_01355 [bacterium]